jgi:RND family efflux transporter MFP subunit
MRRLSLSALLTLLLSCDGSEPGRTDPAGAPSPADTASDQVEATASVRLESENEALLFGAGRITEVYIEEGDSVRAGQILVSMSGDALVDGAVAARSQGLEAARIAAANSLMDYQRCSELYQAGAVSEMDLEGARTMMTASDAEYRMARAEFSSVVSGRAASIVQAPFSGVIGRVWAREGSLAGTEPLVMITGGEGYLARALFPERELGRIEPGAAAWFETTALPGQRFEGVVTSVSPGIDPVTCLIPVTAAFQDSAGVLSPGLFGSLRIVETGVEGEAEAGD